MNVVDKARTVLFLGAGASAPLGKMLMVPFIDHLEKNLKKSNPLFSDIVAKKRDLEFLLEALANIEDISYLRYLLQKGREKASEGSTYVRKEDRKRTEETFVHLRRTATNLRTYVEREVFTHYRAFDNEQSVVELLSPIITQIAEVSALPPVVFTTNYDPAIEKFCELSGAYACIDGLVHDQQTRSYEWSPENYELTAPNNALYLFKLHGSTDWVRSGKRIFRNTSPVLAQGDRTHSNVMIYPATRKIAYEQPYATCYSYLEDCLSKARRCLVIGYSFRDYDTITRFQSSARKNPQLEMEIVAPDAAALVSRLSKEFGIKAKPRTGFLGINSPMPTIDPNYDV
jgi:SIR2-like protein